MRRGKSKIIQHDKQNPIEALLTEGDINKMQYYPPELRNEFREFLGGSSLKLNDYSWGKEKNNMRSVYQTSLPTELNKDNYAPR